MPKYIVRFNVVEEWKGSFEADNLEHAKKLVEQINNDEISTDELPEFEEHNKGIYVEMDEGSLEELPNFEGEGE